MSDPTPAPAALGKRILVFASALGFFAVALGAFGAHGLKERLLVDLPDQVERLAWWQTGVQYHMWHALLLVAMGVLARTAPSRSLQLGAVFAGVGVVLFSGSLYVMTLTGVRWLGAITPFGGTAFLAAWIAVSLAVIRERRAPA